MNNICPYCNNPFEFKTKPLAHAIRCEKRPSDDRKRLKYDLIISRFEVNLQELIYDYEINKFSLPDIKTKYNLQFDYTIFVLDYNNIKRRSLKEATRQENAKNKYKQTCRTKYGVNNVSACEAIKKKKEQTFLDHYGVTNIRKSKEFNDYITSVCLQRYGKKRVTNPAAISETRKLFTKERKKEIYEKYKSTCTSKYGDNFKQIFCEKSSITKQSFDGERKKEIQDKRQQTLDEKYGDYSRYVSDLKNAYSEDKKKSINEKRKATNIDRYGICVPSLANGSESGLEKQIQKILIDADIKWINQFEYKHKFYDLYLPDFNTIIEVNGNYWHANPSIYQADDVILYPGNNKKLAEEIWRRDIKKQVLVEAIGIYVIILWEDFIKRASDDEILNFITNEINQHQANQKNIISLQEI